MTQPSPRILIFSDQPQHYVPMLEQQFPALAIASCETYAALDASLASFQPTVALGCKFEKKPWPRASFFATPSLQWLSVTAAGVEHVTPWDDARVTVTSFAGIAAPEMAQYVLAGIYGLHHGFAHFFPQQARKIWDYRLIRSSRGITVGLVGLGHTGTAVARLLRRVGIRAVAYRSSPTASDEVDRVYSGDQLHTMLAAVDVTVSCAALTPQTSGLFNDAAFAAMKAGSYFINVGRGGLVVEPALIAALQSGHLAGALIDVAAHEPLPASDPLWDAPNLLITPHSCSDFIGWESVAATMFADNLTRWMAGTPLENRVYSWRGY